MTSTAETFNTTVKDAPPWLEAEIPNGFKLDDKGVCFVRPPAPGPIAEGAVKQGCYRVSGPIWVSALSRQANGTGWGRIVKWIDGDQRLHERSIPAARLHEVGPQLAQELANEGLEISHGQERRLSQYLADFHPEKRCTSVDRLGWIDTTDGSLDYVLPQGSVANGQIVYQPERYSPTVSTMKSAGDLENWKEHVAKPCSRQPYVVFGLCSAFGGPLLKHLRTDSGGFNFSDSSSRGKTLIAQVAASVWGCGADPADAPDLAFIRKWNSTANALEALAAAHNDGILILDELGTCSAKDIGSVIYNLLGGQGKNAMDTGRNLKKPRSWRILLLSTGEVSPTQKIENENRTAKAGQLVRFIDIPTGGQIIQGVADPKAFVDRLKRSCGQYYGTAGPLFVKKLIETADNAAELRSTVTELVDSIGKQMTPQQAAPEVARATTRFALVEAAGLLAVRLEILPFTEEEVSRAVRTVHAGWLQEAVSIPDTIRAVESVRDFILKHRDGRIKNLNCTEPDKYHVRDLAGYVDTSHSLYLLTHEGFKEACGGHDPKNVARDLQKLGLLFTNEKDRLLSKHLIPGDSKQTRWYAVKDEILSYHAGDNQADGSGASDHVSLAASR